MGWVAAAVGVASALFGSSSAKKQKVADRKQAYLAFEDNLEKIRRREYTQQQTLGATKALGETAGVLHRENTTPSNYIKEMSSEFKKEIDWMKEYAHRARDLGLTAASVRSQTNTFNAITGGIQTGAAVYGMGS